MAKKECSDKKEVRNKKNSRDDFFFNFFRKIINVYLPKYTEN